MASAARKVTALPLRGKSESVQRGRDWTEQIITHILQIGKAVQCRFHLYFHGLKLPSWA